ncbi:MAG TPA: polyphosphate kinase 1, partial [Segetibacter sp.]
MKNRIIPRDISWLSFNARVLQEANDPNVPLKARIRFLGIFSNNLDEFFRVRVATLKRMTSLGIKNMHMEENPLKILEDIQTIVLQQQNEFNRIWEGILTELANEKIYLVNEQQLDQEQQHFVKKYFEEEVRSNVIPLLVESIPHFPYLREKSIYLGVVMRKKDSAYDQKYALIEVPTRAVDRFISLPSSTGEQYIILLEDVIRFNLPSIFSYFGFDHFDSHIFKVTKDAEIDIDNDISTSLIQKIEKGIKNRRKGKTVRFVYDKEMDAGLLEYLIRKLNLSRKDNIIPGGRIHNFRHFMDFPDVFNSKSVRRSSIMHPAFSHTSRVTDVILEKDVMLHFPYHSFSAIIDLLRESAMDPQVMVIKITAYRLASNSKIINALINAARNGKEVVVMLELRARFDEEANLLWKQRLEEEGVKVLIGVDNLKVHAKICIIKKRVADQVFQYGFVSTGNLNEQTAHVYGDHCLLTSNRSVMADINRMFNYLESPKSGMEPLKLCQTLMVCPTNMRREIIALINREIKNAKSKREASIIIKLNSLSDANLIEKLYEAAHAGVSVKMIVRGIFCAAIENTKFKKPVTAVSIVDEYLEHARVMVFHNDGKEKVYISSADWM